MKAVIQKVESASVTVENNIISSIRNGLVVFLGIGTNDSTNEIMWLTDKISKLRVFENFDKNINDVSAEILLVSQFTLQAELLKGNRPSFIYAAESTVAKPIYQSFIKILNNKIDTELKSGIFGANMKVELINDGPITLVYDSKLKFKK
ncbi:MAG: D-aminoacyl-tRNA deacylase [Flavobacteriaceae bacterium]|nr:D-aminoacyl-tRNA deacylase [Flavobacteriaceae bacterium]